eukprot:scaffold1972_cov103-Isochrysis_galbana.AAC.5
MKRPLSRRARTARASAALRLSSGPARACGATRQLLGVHLPQRLAPAHSLTGAAALTARPWACARICPTRPAAVQVRAVWPAATRLQLPRRPPPRPKLAVRRRRA